MRLAALILFSALIAPAQADESAPAESAPAPSIEDQPPVIREAYRIGVAMGAAQRCGLSAEDADMMTKLGMARLQLVAKDRDLYGKAANVMLESQHYGATDMPQPEGGCKEILPTASGILGNLIYLIARADPDVPDLKRPTPLQNFAAWSGQLAVMASNCGARDEIVNHAVDVARKHLEAQAGDPRDREVAEAELSEVMLQAEMEGWGDKSQCVKILTTFGIFFGNLDARAQKK